MSSEASSSTQTFPSGWGRAMHMLFLGAAFVASAACADDYSDVNALIKAGKLGDALSKAEQYLASKPRDPQMRFIKGVIQTESARPAEAITTFTQITQDYPELPEPYNNLAVLYAGQSQYDKARAALEMAIRTNPSYATAHENLGDVYAKLASQAYSKALQLDGANTGVQPKLALIRTLFAPDTRSQKAGVSSQASGPVTSTPAPPKSAVIAAAPPAAVAPPAAPAVPKVATQLAAATGAEKEVEAAVRAWANAWSGKDIGAYLGSYGKDFATPNGQVRKSWEDERRSRIIGKSRISVKLENLSVAVTGDKATARFKQAYSADSLSVSSRKTLALAKTGDRWLITRESTGG